MSRSADSIALELAPHDTSVAYNIFEHLHGVVPFDETVQMIAPILGHISSIREAGWTFSDDGRLDSSPQIDVAHVARRLVIPPAGVLDPTITITLRLARSFYSSWPSFSPSPHSHVHPNPNPSPRRAEGALVY